MPVLNESRVMSRLDQRVTETLSRLHRDAEADKFVFARSIPAALGAKLRGRSVFQAVAPRLKDAYMPVTPQMGEFLHITALQLNAKTIVEFGSSFGISAIYLSSALPPGGRFIGSEMEPNKVSQARRNLESAGLADVAEIRPGDALETLARSMDQPIDLLFLDGWKDLYVPILKLLTPRLRSGSVVLADNIYTFRRELAEFVATVSNPDNGFASMTLPFKSGLQYSVRI